MKITTLVKCEDSSLVTLPVAAEAEARAKAQAMTDDPCVIGCRFKGMSGTNKAIFAIVSRYPRGHTGHVPAEVGAQLVELGYAEKAS